MRSGDLKRAGFSVELLRCNVQQTVQKLSGAVHLVYPTISAGREGYQVQAVLDASGSPYELSEEMSRRRMEREGVVLTATNTLMAELAQDWGRPEGSQLLGILFQEVLPSIV